MKTLPAILNKVFSVPVLLLLVLLTVFTFAFVDTFHALYRFWTQEYTWRYIVLFLFVLMVFKKKQELVQTPVIPLSKAGILCTIFSSLLIIAGQISATNSVRELSLIFTIFSLVLLLLGNRLFFKLLIPLQYLLLTTSLADKVFLQLTGPLKLITAHAVGFVLPIFGFNLMREGTIFRLPLGNLIEVADSCSGLNQLISMIALAIPLAYITQREMWKKITLLLSAVAVALIMNWLRVLLILIWHYDGPKESVHGPHEIYSLPFIFLGGLFLLCIFALILEKIFEKKGGQKTAIHDQQVPIHLFRKKLVKALLIGISLLLLVNFFIYFRAPVPTTLSKPVSSLPLSLAGFKALDIIATDPHFTLNLADEELFRSYDLKNSSSGNVFIAYFESQSYEKQLIDYRYNWLLNGTSEHMLSPKITINRTLTIVNGEKWNYFFWYNINGRVFTKPWKVKLAGVYDGLTMRQMNGAIIVVTMPVNADQFEQVSFLKAAFDATNELFTVIN